MSKQEKDAISLRERQIKSEKMRELWRLILGENSRLVDFSLLKDAEVIDLIGHRIGDSLIEHGEKGEYGSYSWSEYEDEIFNESRLYQALGKDHARSVLAIWEDFKSICQLLAKRKKFLIGHEVEGEK